MMTKEETIVAKILERFPMLEGKVNVQRRQRIFTDGMPSKAIPRSIEICPRRIGFYHLAFGDRCR